MDGRKLRRYIAPLSDMGAITTSDSSFITALNVLSATQSGEQPEAISFVTTPNFSPLAVRALTDMSVLTKLGLMTVTLIPEVVTSALRLSANACKACFDAEYAALARKIRKK